MKKLYGYSRLIKSMDKAAVIEMFAAYNCVELILDDSARPKSDDSLIEQIKSKLITSSSALIIDSIDSLGKTSREISRELNWFVDNNIELFIISIPTTFTNNQVAIITLNELYNNKATKERLNVAQGQQRGQEQANINNIKTGRPLTPYPDNWEENFALWQEDKITAIEFMEKSHLKKGTFYNLVKRYKAEIKNVNDEGQMIG